LGPGTVRAAFAGDTVYQPAATSAPTMIFAFLPEGVFVIGEQAASGRSVTFWSSQWAGLNRLGDGGAPTSFKGFAAWPSLPACGAGWMTRPGNAAAPPAALPPYMAVIVASSVSKTGSVVSGDTASIVIVKTDSGYAPDPGHPGTGIVVGVICP